MTAAARARACALLLAGGLSAACADSGSTDGAWRAAAEESARELMAEYAARANAGDWDGVLELYVREPAFHWVEDGRVAYTSADSIATAYAGLRASGLTGTMSTRDLRVHAIAPNAALVTALFDQVYADSAGVAFSFSGAVTATAVETPLGWRLLSGHTSTLRER